MSNLIVVYRTHMTLFKLAIKAHESLGRENKGNKRKRGTERE